MLNKFFVDEKGQTLVEYGLLISLIALFVLAAVGIFGRRVVNMWGNNAERFPPLPSDLP